MKEYEKLAMEFIETIEPSDNWTPGPMRSAFMYGFIKCRDALLQDLLENHFVDGFIQKRIREFGEKEV